MTMSIKLFDEVVVTSNRYYKTGENQFKFWEQSSIPEIVRVKNIMNSWFENYPDKDKANLKADFKNKFYDAWYELFLHQLFFLQGFKLEVHPKLPNSTSRPDFLATKKGYSCYIEAKVITGMTEAEMAAGKVRDMIIDQLQSLNLPNHMLSLETLELKGTEKPSLRKMKKWIETKISEINVPEIVTDDDFYNRESLRFENDNILIELKIVTSNLKNYIDDENEIHQPLGIIIGETFMGDANEGGKIIREAFRQKAMKYGKLDKPLLLCFNIPNMRIHLDMDVNHALFNDYMEDKGFFAAKPPKYTTVSAAFFTRASPSESLDFNHRLILHPKPKYLFHFEYCELTFELVRTKTDLHKKKDVGEILKEG